ncbi:MAG: hypothetical protein JRI25_01075 [Deltaproteobacteria bacterium]|nr:hypothetical protein [Deltaproteobacteria bacterium]
MVLLERLKVLTRPEAPVQLLLHVDEEDVPNRGPGGGRPHLREVVPPLGQLGFGVLTDQLDKLEGFLTQQHSRSLAVNQTLMGRICVLNRNTNRIPVQNRNGRRRVRHAGRHRPRAVAVQDDPRADASRTTTATAQRRPDVVDLGQPLDAPGDGHIPVPLDSLHRLYLT